MSKITDWEPYKEKAIGIMTKWLSHENELGKEPKSIAVADEFDIEAGHAFVIKYKASLLSKWLLGVCVLDEEGEDCGLNFSEFEPYEPKTAREKSIQLIEYLQEYWRNRFLAELERYGVTEEEFNNMSKEEWEKKKEEANKKQGSGSHGFVLLETPEFDFERFLADMKTEWEMEITDYELKDNNLVFNWESNLLAVSLIDAPVPNGEAEHMAGGNYMWKGAVDAAKKHTAQLVVFAINQEQNVIEASLYLSKMVSACINQENVLGIYAAGTVHEPKFYKEVATVMKKEELPLPIWIYFGFGRSEEGNDGYTYGLQNFGKLELEVINSKESFEDIRNFLYGVCMYLITENMTFYDGETLKFTADDEYKITKSEAVYVDGETFKIAF